MFKAGCEPGLHMRSACCISSQHKKARLKCWWTEGAGCTCQTMVCARLERAPEASLEVSAPGWFPSSKQQASLVHGPLPLGCCLCGNRKQSNNHITKRALPRRSSCSAGMRAGALCVMTVKVITTQNNKAASVPFVPHAVWWCIAAASNLSVNSLGGIVQLSTYTWWHCKLIPSSCNKVHNQPGGLGADET